jgi:hypothetical protein
MPTHQHLKTKEDYGEGYEGHLLAQYELMAESADRVSSRRQAASGLLVTLNGAIVTAAAAMLTTERQVGSGLSNELRFAVIVSAIAGIAICIVWVLILKSHRELNRAKFEVIGVIEKNCRLPHFKRNGKNCNRAEGRIHSL